jgi:hypothetical protein
MEDVGERWIKVALINPKSDAYRGVAQTTWADLRSQELIEDAKARCVLLSAHGWEMGIRSFGAGHREWRENVGHIYKSIKSLTVRTNLDAISPVRLGRVASHAGLPAGFVANVIEARLIESWLNRRGVTWASGFEGRVILVPVDFGLELS